MKRAQSEETQWGDMDLYQLHPDIPQSSIVFGSNPSNKISQYIFHKLNPQIAAFSPFQKAKRMAQRPTSLTNVMRNIANTISPSKSKRGREDLHVITPSNESTSSPRLRNTVSGPQQSNTKTLKSKSRQKHKKTQSASSSVPTRPLPPINASSQKRHSNPAFNIELNLNRMHNLAQALEPISPVSAASPSSDESFRKRPSKPIRDPPPLPSITKKRDSNHQLIAFCPMPSHSDDNRSSDTSEAEQEEEASMVVHGGMDQIYTGLPITSGNDTPDTLNLNKPIFDPFGSLAPLSEPEPDDFKMRDSQSAQQLNIMRTPSTDSIVDQMAMDDDDEEKQFQNKSNTMMMQAYVAKKTNNKRKGTHKRTLSLKDQLKGLVKSNSLRNLRGSRTGHRKTQSSQSSKRIFDDNDGQSDSKDSEDDYDAESEDSASVIAKYKNMDFELLQEEKLKLMEEYREIAWKLWDKYVRVGAEYEINIDYAERRKFFALMRNKEEWMRGVPEVEDEEKFIKLFYKCTEVMLTFLSNSFTRFRHKPDFDRVQEFLII